MRINPLLLILTTLFIRTGFADEPADGEPGVLVRAESRETLRRLKQDIPEDIWDRNWEAVVSSTTPDIPGLRELIPKEETLEVTGSATGSDGKPAVGAEVWAAGIYADTPHRERTTTNDRGEFKLHLRPLQDESARWTIQVFHNNEAARTVEPLTIRTLSDPVPHIALLLQPCGKLKGTVLEASTRRPISGAYVYLEDGRILVTDTDGRFAANGIRRTQQDLGIVASGRVRRYIHFDASRQQETLLNVNLHPSGLIAGRVMTATHVSVPDAVLDFSGSGNALVLESRLVMSDNDGHFVFDGVALDTLHFGISASAAGMTEADLNMLIIRSDQPVCLHDFILSSAPENQPSKSSVNKNSLTLNQPLATRTLSGIVLDDNGDPVVNASVKNGATMYEYKDINCTTDDNGQFQLEGLPTTDCFVTIQAKGFAPHFEKYSASISEKTIHLTQGRTVGGIVESTNGKPLQGIMVVPVIASPDPRLCNPYWLSRLTAKTDDRGYFSITSLPDLPVNFDFLGDGLSDVRGANLTLESNENRLVMSSAGAIRGQVLDSDGQPIENFRLRIDFPRQRLPREQFKGFTASFRTKGILFSDADGRFQLSDLPSNCYYRVTVDADGHSEASVDRAISIPVNEMTDEDGLNFVVGKAYPLTVEVTDGKSGMSIPRASVTINADPLADPAKVQWDRDLIGLPSLLTDTHGKTDWTLSSPEGIISVLKPGFARTSIRWNSTQPKVDVVLSTESRVHVSIKTKTGQQVPGCWMRIVDVMGSSVSLDSQTDSGFEVGELEAGNYELTIGFENQELYQSKITLMEGEIMEIPVVVDGSSGKVAR